MKDGKPVKISKEAREYLEIIRKTPLGEIPIGRVASAIILEHKKRKED